MNEVLEVPTDISFKQAIDLTQLLLDQVVSRQIQESEVEVVVSDLVRTQNGARGFFVTYLTSDLPVVDRLTNSVVEALRSHPETVAELLVKNIAMSAAQAIYHHRNQAEEMAQGSLRVQQRTQRLIQLVNLAAVDQHAQELLDTATTGEGSYKNFLNRWGYDTEQRQVICQALQQVLSRAS
ncbi:hypothetical protein [Gloeocapsopsis dulcis]|uniref:Uncharacterized protein n=1 Tax=Gloeocapsopsis dulcis AAB1 = 1H9 TaxID=1433147 RepID=A0A6N8G2J8_9CHRO|nr:hypothetical protein [Gloeocapsopsis dulcis]MUL38567.1 hypothetical protein [Gloeocapsopsis dulcis AAB1 = 1H9]WNN91128.1 hypothetical protein P0S91_08660 [Gloeocapsopsis dulcis]